MGPGIACYLEIAAVVAVALLIVALVLFASGAFDDEPGRRRAAVHADVESALADATLMTYEQAAKKSPPPRQKEEDEERCAFCLSEYAKANELVRVVAACGHFFHAECGIDRWLRTRRTCPLCRGGLWPPLPRLTKPECPPMPQRASGGAFAIAIV